MRPSPFLLGRNKALRSTIKQRFRQNIKRTKTEEIGRHTKYGGYIVDYNKVKSYVVPQGLDKFSLTPFVTTKIQPSPDVNGEKLRGNAYLQRWKAENGED